MSKEHRIEYIDFFRGIGIILMIINHVDFGGVIYNFSHAFHMPMFFIISGLLYSKKTEQQLSTVAFFKKKAKSLLLPYCVLGIIHYLIWISLYGFSLEPLKFLFFLNTEKGMPIAGALWFLTALFISETLYFVLDRYSRNRIVFICSVVLLSLFGTMARMLLPFTLPLALSAGFVGVGLFGIGVLLRRASGLEIFTKFENSKPLFKMLAIIILAVTTFVLIYFNGAVNMRDGRYSLIPLFWINATLATVTGLLFSKSWLKVSRNSMLNNYVCSIGRESIVYLCLNQLVISFLKRTIDVIKAPHIVIQLIILLTSLVILYFICRITFMTRLKSLFGK